MSNLPAHNKPKSPANRPTQSPLTSYQQKLRAALAAKLGTAQQSGPVPPGTCLLLDLSGSMSEYASAGDTRLGALVKVVKELPECPRFGFSKQCQELAAGIDLVDAYWKDFAGGTHMDKAFNTVRAKGYKNIVLITDGEPNNEELALKAAQGLVLNIFYVGPEPVPQFLRDLAAQTGGSFGAYTFSQAPALTTAIRGLLAPPSSVPAKKGSIEL